MRLLWTRLLIAGIKTSKWHLNDKALFIAYFRLTNVLQTSQSIIVVQFDGDEDEDTGITPERHIPARFVVLIPRDFPGAHVKKKRKSAIVSDGGNAKKKQRNSSIVPAASSRPLALSKAPPAPLNPDASSNSILFNYRPASTNGKQQTDTTNKSSTKTKDVPLKLPTKKRPSMAKRNNKKEKEGERRKSKSDGNPNLAASHFED